MTEANRGEPLIVSPREAARLLGGVSVKHLYDLIREGRAAVYSNPPNLDSDDLDPRVRRGSSGPRQQGRGWAFARGGSCAELRPTPVCCCTITSGREPGCMAHTTVWVPTRRG